MAHSGSEERERELDLMGAEIFEFEGMGHIDEGGDQRDPVSMQTTLTQMMEEAVDHYEENLEPLQVEATDYYYGRPFGDEENGRSSVVSTDIRDATQSQIPDLMRIFFGSDNVVSFIPQSAGQRLLAEQQTDLVNQVIRDDNDGFLSFHNTFKDALVRSIGYFKWWWEDYDRPRGYTMTGIDQNGLMELLRDPEVEILVLAEGEDPVLGTVYDVDVKWFKEGGRARFMSVPPEEIVFTPNARSFEDAALVAHVREVTIDEAARVTGLSVIEIEEFAGDDERGRGGSENLPFARQFHGSDTNSNLRNSSVSGGTSTMDDVDNKPLSQRPVLLTEAYVKTDQDGDEISELRMFHCLGRDYDIVNGEEGELVSEIPISYITPDPEPHTIVGLSNYDNLRDVQRVKSQIQRATLNSLAQAVEPQMEAVTGEVNMKDLTSPEISNIIRVRRPGMLREIRHTFLGGEAISVEEHWNDIRADRGGMTRASEGLDPNALQSSTTEAVAATLNKAQQRIEIIARIFAETGVSRLYIGLLNLITENQDTQMTVELRGEFVDMDPRSWTLDTKVRVNPALGTGSLRDRLTALSAVASDQAALQQSGSPLVSNVEVRNTRKHILELGGLPDTTEFYRPWTVEDEQKMQEAIANQPPPPDPAMLLVENEQLKTQLRGIEVQNKQKFEELKLVLEDDRARDQLARETAVEVARINESTQGFESNVILDRQQQDADLPEGV